jgi:hypothetical protein
MPRWLHWLIVGPRRWYVYWLCMAIAVMLIAHFWQGESWGLSGAAGIVFATLSLFVDRAVRTGDKAR